MITVSEYTEIKPQYANRHGLIAGATGTGKTVTLQTIIEGMSKLGTTCFVADVKGDLAGLKMDGRGKAQPVRFWDVYGKLGERFRLHAEDIGPDLLARMLGLTDAQQGVLEDVMLDNPGIGSLDDISVQVEAADTGKATRDAVLRAIRRFQRQGGNELIGYNGFDLGDIYGHEGCEEIIHILEAGELSRQPRAYGMLMIWFLRELMQRMPERGDTPYPLFALFIDEAHLLFQDADRALIRAVEQAVRLVRSKGVAVYFVTQNPDDLPSGILSQLGNRVQHALRGATPRDQRAIRAAAETMPKNPRLDAAAEISRLQTGEALVSFLDDTGSPTPVEKVKVNLPNCRLGPVTIEEREVPTEMPWEGDKIFGWDKATVIEVAEYLSIPALFLVMWYF